jgi:hypothetical protein
LFIVGISFFAEIILSFREEIRFDRRELLRDSLFKYFKAFDDIDDDNDGKEKEFC